MAVTGTLRPAESAQPAAAFQAAEAVLASRVRARSPGVAAALDPESARERARDWAAGAFPGAQIADVLVGSVLYRPDGSCSLRYHLRFEGTRQERVLLVQVPAGGEAVVRPFPDDPALPTLRLAADPVLMRDVLGRVVPGTGGERAVGRCTVDVVRHARHGRCVLRYRLSPGAGGPGELRHPVLFGKVYADGAAPAAAAAAARLLRAGLRGDAPVQVPRPLGVSRPLRLGLAEAMAGRPTLPDLVKDACFPGGAGADGAVLSDAVRAAAGVAAAIHACAPPRDHWAPRTLAGEVAATERELAALAEVWPEVAARLRRAVADAVAAEEVAGPGSDTPVLAHGDFTPGQLLLGGPDRPGLVDVDTVCLAEPALDLGRFLAYLQVTGVRRSRHARPLVNRLAATFVEAYLSGTAASPDERRWLGLRTAAYRALTLARLGASACWQLKDDRARAVLDVMDTDDEG